ncbi:glycoside hydrolase family 32 protein [Microbacterium hominis]|uniref:glycoside hydrolase family 32 protein n=1 Tax=Microbacterium hominis TaxID=162426 RepID=UPI00196565D2|nr:glycoside hydrolase family 32 protein [Microbacterium hominis]QRY39935.1 glycoside hydrolase family 32 protein [Microbacterium hominis]
MHPRLRGQRSATTRSTALRTVRGVVCALGTVVALAAAPAVTASASASASEPAPSLRAQYHFTVPDHWKNDPQRPVYIDGAFHYYYLYNADYDANPSANFGTAWRLATTTDGVSFADQGIAAPKGTNANYDLWSGSAVVDHAGTAGFGAGAVVMLVTQMDHPTPAQKLDASGQQAQFLWYSIDGGRTFRPDGDQPVIPGDGRRDFRDPKVVWDPDHQRWVALIAEGDRVSIYTSPDLHSWTRRSEYVNTGIGTIECPDLFRIRADDDTFHWVFGVSANGFATGEPATFAYWTGSFDGERFTPDRTAPQWLDHGFDWYGAVTWEDPSAPDDRRYAVAWMNNWDYAHSSVTWPSDGFTGTDSLTREIRLVRNGTGYTLASQPVAALQQYASARHELGDVTVDGFRELAYQGDAYEITTRVSRQTAQNIGLQLRRSADGSRHADAGVTSSYAYLNRGQTGHPSPTHKLESRTPFDGGAGEVTLRILVDRTTIEVFVDDGRYVQSSQVFAPAADRGLALYTSGGPAVFHDLTITEFAGLAQRPARVIADFEGTTWGDGWTATGSLAGIGPSAAELPGQVGARVADTFAGSDAATGVLTSPPFVVDRDHLHLLIAGGQHPLGVEPATSVQLLIDGQPVRTATGDDSATLRPVDWDVRAFAGRTAQLQILDDATGAWGHLMVDHVVLSD